MKAPLPVDEHERLAALRQHRILDTPPEQHLDDITQLAAHICGTPTALITFVDAERQWFKSRVGWAVPETSRDVSFCAHAIHAKDGELVVADAARDERFADNPLVLGDPHIRFYAGLPLVTVEGHALGTLCVIDRVPRVLQAAQLAALRALRRAITTELELRRSRGVAGIVESMSDGFVTLDSDWRYTYVNARAAKLFGRSAASLIGANYHEEYPEAAGTPFGRAYRKAMEERVALVIEEHYAPWDRWFENRVFPTPEGIAIFFREISERKVLEKKLIDEQAKLRTLIDGLGPGIFVGLMRPDGTLIEASAPALFVAGIQLEDVIGKPVDQTYWFAHSAAEQYRLRAAIARAATGEPSLYDVQIQVREGELLWIEFSLQPLRDERGEIAYLVPSGVDIGKRKRAEQDLRDSTARLELAAQSGNVGLWDWDLRTDRVFYSPEWKRQVGYEPHEIADDFSEWRSRVHPDDLAGALQRVEAFIAKPSPNHQLEFRLRHKDGSYRWIFAQGALQHDTDGIPVRMLGSHVDITERKLAEAAVRERERQLSTLMANLPGMAYRCRNDADYTIEFVSDGITELTGYPASDFREHRRQFGSMIHPQDQQPVWDEIQAALGAKRPFELTYRLQTATGERWVWERGQGIHDAGGELLALEGFITDITERKRAEQARLESEERYRALAESSPDAILIHQQEKITFVNRAMVHLMRARDAADLVGRSSTFMLAPESVEPARKRTLALYSGKPQPRAEQTYIRLDGTPVQVEIAAAPLVLEGTPAAQVTVRDVSERHAAAARERAALERFEVVARATNEGIWDWDLRTNALWWNDSFCSLFRYPPGAIGTDNESWVSRIHPDDRARILGSVRSVLDGGGRLWTAEYRFQRGDQSYAHVWDRGSVIRDERDRPVRMIGAMSDITERKRAESLLEGQKRALEMIASDAPLRETLDTLLRVSEAQFPDMLGSILLLDADGQRVRHGAAPSLPEAFMRAVDGGPIGERAGSCGTAAYRRAPVIVEDIATDPLWESYRPVALAHGLRACWSTPIFDAEQRLVGTFAMYFREPKRPGEGHLHLIQTLTSTAGIAIGGKRASEDLRQANARLQALSEQLLQVQEKERASIARELHDELGQSLTAIKLNALAAARRLKGPAAEKMAQCVAIVDQALAQTRNLALDLRPPQLDQLGLAATLRDYLERCAAGAGLEARFVAGGHDIELDRELSTAAFRVAQEALTNVARHAQARQVVVELRVQNDELLLAVSDDGRGYDHAAARMLAIKGKSMGLLGMEERVALAGGRLLVVTRPGQGTRVQVAFPLHARPAQKSAG